MIPFDMYKTVTNINKNHRNQHIFITKRIHVVHGEFHMTIRSRWCEQFDFEIYIHVLQFNLL